jgi:hypothetical protein
MVYTMIWLILLPYATVTAPDHMLALTAPYHMLKLLHPISVEGMHTFTDSDSWSQVTKALQDHIIIFYHDQTRKHILFKLSCHLLFLSHCHDSGSCSARRMMFKLCVMNLDSQLLQHIHIKFIICTSFKFVDDPAWLRLTTNRLVVIL